ncbi:hypothetical protein [Bradyrhizobium prioriisuperbiae]|uniref:hypothetical protein n=1 Tax=Bradyrhizobium prioriisuperbiae TaxID=2854389 RepID=UPI0028EE2E39|nr:hypothetical protein [Bradyrhizobium prioritasuperba]
MPKTKDDFLVFHWNLQKKSLNSLISDNDMAQLVAKGITDNVRRRGKSRDPLPLVGFLQEVIGTRDDVASICGRLKKEFEAQRGEDAKHLGNVTFEAYPTGGKASMKEWTVVVSQGLDVTKVEDLNVRDEYARVIETDKTEAAQKKHAFDNRPNKRAAQKKAKQETYRSTSYEARDFRDGLVAEIKLPGNQSSRIATIHAPGPKIMKDLPGLLPAIPRSAATANVAFLTGDLNADGNLNKNDEVVKTGFRNIGADLGGTTFKKSAIAPGSNPLGVRVRDRSFVHESSQLYTKRWKPIAVDRQRTPRVVVTMVPKKSRPGFATKRKSKSKRTVLTGERAANLLKTVQPDLFTDHALIVTKVRWNDPAPSVAGTSPLQPAPSVDKTFSVTLKKGAAASTHKLTTDENTLDDPTNPMNEEEMTDVTQVGAEDDAGEEDENGVATEAESDAEMGATEELGGEEVIDLLALAL